MRGLGKVSMAVLLVSALAWAGEPWKGKPYQKWDHKDVERVLDHSPWSEMISVPQTWGMQIRTTTRTVTTLVPRSEVPALQAGAVPTGPPPSAVAPQVPFEARWISARTMREALARQLLLAGKMTQAGAEQFVSEAPAEYQIDVFGPDMAPFAKLDEAALAKATFLQLDGSKAALAPGSIKLLRAPDGKAVTAIIVSFPEVADGKPTVPAGETGLNLVCKTELATLKFHFDPRKMTVEQRRDL